ncbi:MAG: VOC family protein [Reyranella sp.]|uniref:VOC family protein n=1 Tax=Reyranella sp. TaxID=1929291 RepID=UPI00121B50EF|nr:VOC family protein [Reyranella sp.]TAJ85292.1 MAG: VOC family protein [Reyranella sp.]TBR25314.1 MAG: VOC family protein [Reyranella sp.]
METHRGRLIDHLHLKVRDLEASKRFYKAAMEALGVPLVEGADHFFADELWVDVGPAVAHVHFAFQARDRATVDRFHAAVLAAGGRDNGAPGERDYHPGYYAAFAFDPDGNNVEAVHHGPHNRSADSVHITW